jgi:hypothetical protein
MRTRNQQRNFSPDIENKLGHYVYALRDPRDKKIFYVGKGTGSRIFDHFNEAERVLLTSQLSSKLHRIVEIWEEGIDVEWFIIRHGIQDLVQLSSDTIAEDVEAAVMDALEASQNGPTVNDASGRRSNLRGLLDSDDVRALAAKPVDPDSSYPLVFVFAIQTALAEGRSIYDATRRAWSASDLMVPRAIAVGLAAGISKGVFEVIEWESISNSDRKGFRGKALENHELADKNWTSIIAAASGYWQRGNYLVVEFNGQGQFRLKRGARDKDILRDLR